MSTSAVTVGRIVNPDGTVEVLEKVNMPAGKVQVTLVPLSEVSPDDPFWQRMHNIWEGQRALGHVPRGVEEGYQLLHSGNIPAASGVSLSWS